MGVEVGWRLGPYVQTKRERYGRGEVGLRERGVVLSVAGGGRDQLVLVEFGEGDDRVTRVMRVTDLGDEQVEIGDKVETVLRKMGEEGDRGPVWYGLRVRRPLERER